MTPGSDSHLPGVFISQAMKKAIVLLFSLASLFSACRESEREDVLNAVLSVPCDAACIQTYMRENVYIDVDIKALARAICAGEEVDARLMAQAKVALYRYFSQVTVEGGHYRCEMSSGDGMALSPRLFDALQENLQEMNRGVDAMRRRDATLQLPPVDSAYLQSLLR